MKTKPWADIVVEEAIQRRELKRQAAWSEALAVGNQQFVERVTGVYEARRKYVYAEASIAAGLSTWTIRADSLPYNAFSGVEQSL